MTASFNLVDEPWIPTVDAGGSTVLRSLRDALRDASRCNLAASDPLEFVALVRQVLLPVAIDATKRPRSAAEWAARLAAPGFDQDRIERYLDAHRHRFDLFDPAEPFGQVAGLEAVTGGTKPARAILVATPSGNNVPVFGSATDADAAPLDPPAAARAMLALQCWDTAGIKTGAAGDPAVSGGKTTGNRTGSAGSLGVVIPWAADLYRSLVLNMGWSPGDVDGDDPPPWRRSPPGPSWGTLTPSGLVQLLTWQARRVRLVPDAGAGRPAVSRAVVAAGDRMAELPRDLEPHTMWRRVDRPRPGEPAWRPLRHRSGRALWRGMPSLLALSAARGSDATVETSHLVQAIANLAADGLLPDGVAVDVVAVGVEYGNQSAVVENVIADRLPLPLAALAPESPVREILLAMAAAAEDLRRAADRLEDDLARASGGSAPAPVAGERLVAALDRSVRDMVVALRADPGAAPDLWGAWLDSARASALAIAEPLLRSVPPSAFLGRAQAGGQPRHGSADAERWFRNRVRRATSLSARDDTQEGRR